MKNYYSLLYCEDLIERYINQYGGKILQIEEGCLGLGKLLLHSAPRKKTVVITEFFINSWSSGHKVRKYNIIPKCYQKLVDDQEIEEATKKYLQKANKELMMMELLTNLAKQA
jgi:hypothetical protein